MDKHGSPPSEHPPKSNRVRLGTTAVILLLLVHLCWLWISDLPGWSHAAMSALYVLFVTYLVHRKLVHSQQSRATYRDEPFAPFIGELGLNLASGDPQTIKDLYQNEYNKGADRYQNIYTAVWQNFSYMAILAAGILTFGKGAIDSPSLVAIAILPLIFWYVASFVPLDHYGQQNGEYLKKMERTLHGIDAGHFVGFRRADPPWHVNEAVHRTAVLVGWIFGIAFLTAFDHQLRGETHVEPEQAAVTLSTARVEVAPITQLDSVGRLLASVREELRKAGLRTLPPVQGEKTNTTRPGER